MYCQLYEWFRTAIVEGRMRPGQRVPSTRSLAAELKISRIPVYNAYEQLLAEGFFETFVGAGTCIARSIPREAIDLLEAQTSKPPKQIVEKLSPRRISERAKVLASGPEQPWLKHLGAFRVSLPAIEHFPTSVWSKLVARHSRRPPKGVMTYGSPLGYRPFREAIAEYLSTVRGVRCDSSQACWLRQGPNRDCKFRRTLCWIPKAACCLKNLAIPERTTHSQPRVPD